MIRVSQHAIDRYIERVAPVTNAEAIAAIMALVLSAFSLGMALATLLMVRRR